MAKLSRGKSTSTSSAGGRGGGLGFTFLLIAAFVLLILLTAAGGVVANLLVGAQTARNDLNALLTSSQSVQTSFQQQRYRQLQLISRIFATDPVLTGYLAEAAQRRDRTKILDLVEEYQNLLTFDLAFVLDRNGVLLARTDDPQAVGEDISQTPIVAVALEDDEAFGVWQQGDRLYHAVAVPLVREFDLVGYILVAFTINDSLALQLKRMSGADVVFLLNGQTGPMVAASTLDSGQQAELISALRLSGEVLDRTMRRGETVSDIDLAFRGTSTALIAPLKNAAEAPVGAALSVIAAESRQAGYRQTLAATLASAGAALLAAFVVAFALGRRPFKPLKPLADSAVALAEGDTHQVIETDGLKGDYHRIGNSLDAIAADQREQRALQAYVTHISRYQPEPARYEAPPRPETDLLALMMIEFRRFANPKVGYDAEESLGRFGRDLRRVATMVAARKGSIEAALGHRVLIRFTGDDAPRRALGAAAEVLRMLSERENVFDEPEPPAIALSHGSTVTGAVQWEGGGSRAAIGLPLHQLEGILREATPGDLYLTRPITEVLLEDIQKAGVRPTAQKSLMSTQQLYAIKIEDAAAVAGVEFRSASETQTIFQRDQRALADVAPGSLLGNRFEVLASLGIGRMGVVLKVRDRDRDVLSALKLLKPEMMDQQQVERLAGQVRLLRAVQHPNVVGVLDFGQVDGLPYLLLDYVRGLTLRTLLAAGRAVPPLAALRIAKDMVSGLGAMHTERLLHRDLRPENIFLDPAGNVKLADAGIAPPLDSAAGVQLTSPSYLAPEQLEGRTLDPRADFFSAGVVMYEMFTGQVPVAGGTLTEIRTRRRETLIEPPSQHNADLPEALDQLVMRCLDPDPDKRFEDADALRTALDALAG